MIVSITETICLCDACLSPLDELIKSFRHVKAKGWREMNITILGAGNMGSAFVKQFTRAGHKVRVTARSAEKAAAVAAANPGAVALPPSEALGDSTVVIVATGYQDAVPALKSLGSLAGKVV